MTLQRIGEILPTNTLNFSQTSPEPEPEVCEFCGQVSPYEALRNPFTNSVITWLKPQRCQCEQAQKKWAEIDEAERKKRQVELELVEARKKMEKINKLFEQSNLGRRFKDRTFDNFKITKINQQAFNICKDYSITFQERKEKGEGLLLTGSVGTGKTHLAASIANYLLTNMTPVIFGNITSLLGRIRETYNGGGNEKEVIDSLITADLLIIDDLGKENSSDWVLEKLYLIINSRYEDYKPIVVTTNLMPDELERKIGEASWSRIVEMCTGVIMNGDDFRKNKLR